MAYILGFGGRHSVLPRRVHPECSYLNETEITHCERDQCTLHLALDLQGRPLLVDLVARMYCRAEGHRNFWHDPSDMAQLHRETKSSQELGNSIASQLKVLDFSQYRTERLKTYTASTVNHEHRYTKSGFTN